MKKLLAILCAACLMLSAVSLVALAKPAADAATNGEAQVPRPTASTEYIAMNDYKPFPGAHETLIDFKKVSLKGTSNEDLNEEETGDKFCHLEDGMVHVHFANGTSDGGWWWQTGLDTCEVDDETGELGAALPGFKPALNKWYDRNAKDAGIAFFVDATDVLVEDKENEPFWIALYIEEVGEKDKSGNPILCGKKKRPAITCYRFIPEIPDNFMGWIKLPFNELYTFKWGDTPRNIDDADGKFNADCIHKITFVSSLNRTDFGIGYGDDESVADLYIGNVVVWGKGHEKPAVKPTEKPSSAPEQSSSVKPGANDGTEEKTDAPVEESTEAPVEGESNAPADNPSEAASETVAEQSSAASEGAESGSNTGLIIGIVAAVIIVAAGVGVAIYLVAKKKKQDGAQD